MPVWSSTDLTLPEVPASERRGRLGEWALTVLYHPDPERIGCVSRVGSLAGQSSFTLSRLQPLFAAEADADTPPGEPLQDQYISRAPVTFECAADRVTIHSPAGKPSLKLNGNLISGCAVLPRRDIECGVVVSLAQRVVLLLHRIEDAQDGAFGGGLIGNSDGIRRVRGLIGRVADTEASVLLLGESGTGKELVAAAIHEHSRRANRPLVSVNMAALPEDLAAAELFGIQRGAFTGADRDRPGYFQRADGGSLFLDEIGACSTAVQPQLLRALQQGEIQSPGGGTHRVDVRVIAATDADLDDTGAGFSTALRHRLAGFEIHLPPLRDRREDLGRLLRHFLPTGLLNVFREKPREVSRWANLVEGLALYRWPGNVREFANVCSQLEIAGDGGSSLVIPDSLGAVLARRPQQKVHSQAVEPPSDSRVREVMMAARFEIAEAARQLQISRQALYRRIQAIPELRVAADIPGAEIESVYHECRGDLDEAALRLEVSRAALRRRWRAMDLIPNGY